MDHGVGSPETHLSLQFPARPTVPVQRMMIFVLRESPAQYAPPVAGQAKVSVVELLGGGEVSVDVCLKIAGFFRSLHEGAAWDIQRDLCPNKGGGGSQDDCDEWELHRGCYWVDMVGCEIR